MSRQRRSKRQRQGALPVVDDRNAVALRFLTREAANHAVGIILAEAPDHAFMFPDSFMVIMNKEDQQLFDGLPYVEEGVAKPGEVSNEELASLRFDNLFGRHA